MIKRIATATLVAAALAGCGGGHSTMTSGPRYSSPDDMVAKVNATGFGLTDCHSSADPAYPEPGITGVVCTFLGNEMVLLDVYDSTDGERQAKADAEALPPLAFPTSTYYGNHWTVVAADDRLDPVPGTMRAVARILSH